MPSVNHDSRRSFRLPLMKPLFVGALLVLTGCGFFEGKSEYEQVQDKRQGLIDVIAEAGGTAKREARSAYGQELDGWFVDLSGAELTDDVIQTLLKIGAQDAVFDLNLSGSTVTNEQLAELDAGKVLQKCFVLDLRDTAITDAGLDGLSNFYVIQELKLKGTSVTPAAVKRLGDKQLAQKFTPEPLRKRPKVDI